MMNPLFVPDQVDRLAQRQSNPKVGLAFNIMTGTLLGIVVAREIKELFWPGYRHVWREMDRREDRGRSR